MTKQKQHKNLDASITEVKTITKVNDPAVYLNKNFTQLLGLSHKDEVKLRLEFFNDSRKQIGTETTNTKVYIKNNASQFNLKGDTYRTYENAEYCVVTFLNYLGGQE